MRTKLIAFTSCLLFFSQSAWALNIASPKEGEVFYAGSKLNVIVKPEAGENWERVLLEIVPMSYNIFTREYKEAIEIPADFLGNITITVLAADKSGKVIKLKRNIYAKLPLNVVLQGIVAGDAGDDFVSLRKMPEGSNATDVDRYETSQLSTYGKYSDNVNREMTAASSGTTYTSSNEKVATVSSEGKVTAQGLGTATITVKNGKYSATVKVVVKAYKK